MLSEFEKRMRAMLGGEYDALYGNLIKTPVKKGIRVNLLRADKNVFEKLFKNLVPVPFCENGFYLEGDAVISGIHPYHHAGVFYIQEPSAMSVDSVLAPEPGDRVLDLCAAPGGKSAQIGERLRCKGLLWSNEVIFSRAKILQSNIERMGIQNAVVSSMHPDALCGKLSGFFDKVLVDAPCSGEGMFRKEPKAEEAWSEAHVKSCAKRQLEILNSAKRALRPGGIMVYSTCTFSKEENEDVIFAFLKDNPDFSLVDCGVSFGERSKAMWSGEDGEESKKMLRIFPSNGGEGHFAAKLQRHGESNKKPDFEQIKYKAISEFKTFWEETFSSGMPQRTIERQGRVFILPEGLPKGYEKCRFLRVGVLAGEIKKNRFVPSHQLFMAYTDTRPEKTLNLTLNDEKTAQYLSGHEVGCGSVKGYAAVKVDGFPLGYGKASNGVLKNHYPKGLRNIK